MKNRKKGIMAAAAVPVTLVWILMSAAAGTAQERETLDFLLNEEEKAQFLDIISTSETVSKQSQEKLEGFLSQWQKLKDNFENLPPELQNMINTLENEGLSSKVNQALGGLQKFNSGVAKFKDWKGKADTVINFYDRYRPDKENPFRSLEVLNNLFEDLEKLLPEEKEYEAFRNTTAWLIRTALRYFREGVRNAHDGLKNFQKLIQERGGAECIGFRGGGITDRSNPKQYAFERMDTGEIICYFGVRPQGGEVWANETGAAVFVWDGRNWTRLATGRTVTESIFFLWRMAHGRVISVEELIDWCNNRMAEFVELRDRAARQYAALTKMDICQEIILEKMNLREFLDELMSAVQRDPRQFTAQYIFQTGEVRGLADSLVDAVTGFALVNGEVKDNDDDKPVGNAEVTIETGTRKHTAITDSNGRFEMLLSIPIAEQRSNPRLVIRISASGYAELQTDTRLQEQCWDMGWLKLSADEPAAITVLFLNPAEADLKVGQSVAFRVNAEREDGTVESVPLSLVEFSGASAGVFSAEEAGTFTVTAMYEGRSASAVVRVEADEEPGEEEDIDEAIEDIAGDEDEDPCSMDYVQALHASLDGLTAEIRLLNAEFRTYAAKFDQEVNRQLAPPCNNQLLAYCFANAVDLASRIEVLVERVHDIVTEIIMIQALCPDMADAMSGEGMTISSLLAGISGLGSSAGVLEAMRSRLRESSCDENEVIQIGQQLVPPELDPDFVQDGGIMQEIPGDGVDNDGDGLQDENVTPLAGFNITFVLYDSGNLKDDVFGLAVSTYGNLGSTPAGGLRSYGLNLPPGTYTAAVTVISAPDNVGTFTLVILQDGEQIGAASGAPSQGATVRVPFTVR